MLRPSKFNEVGEPHKHDVKSQADNQEAECMHIGDILHSKDQI